MKVKAELKNLTNKQAKWIQYFNFFFKHYTSCIQFIFMIINAVLTNYKCEINIVFYISLIRCKNSDRCHHDYISMYAIV